jgi:hypothetical protein
LQATLLVFLAAAARAGVVAPDAFVRIDRRHLRRPWLVGKGLFAVFPEDVFLEVVVLEVVFLEVVGLEILPTGQLLDRIAEERELAFIFPMASPDFRAPFAGADPNPDYLANVERVTANGWRQLTNEAPDTGDSATGEIDPSQILDALDVGRGRPP